MKTIKKTILVALMFGTLVSYANENLIINYNEKGTKVELKDVKKGNQIVIKDSYNHVLYKQTINNNGSYRKSFNFSSLKNGKYYLEVIKEFKIISTPFLIKFGKASFKNKDLKTTYKPFIKIKDNKILISKLNTDASNMKVNIYYNGNQILSEKVTGGNTLHRIYSLDKKYNGDYVVTVNVNSRQYSIPFSL